MRQSRIQRTAPLARIGPRRITSRNRTVRSPIVRRQPSRITSLSVAGTSLLSGRKLLRRPCVRSPSALLLLKRGMRRKNHSTRSPRRRSRKRRSKGTNSRSGTRSRRSNGMVLSWFRLGCNAPGAPESSDGTLFLPSGDATCHGQRNPTRDRHRTNDWRHAFTVTGFARRC